uniref:Putative secreted protein n=1 Tax=Anopheles triannulatus TaxID=58253 RepID=A0A2M4B0U8_9DIPT
MSSSCNSLAALVAAVAATATKSQTPAAVQHRECLLRCNDMVDKKMRERFKWNAFGLWNERERVCVCVCERDM